MANDQDIERAAAALGFAGLSYFNFPVRPPEPRAARREGLVFPLLADALPEYEIPASAPPPPAANAADDPAPVVIPAPPQIGPGAAAAPAPRWTPKVVSLWGRNSAAAPPDRPAAPDAPLATVFAVLRDRSPRTEPSSGPEGSLNDMFRKL